MSLSVDKEQRIEIFVNWFLLLPHFGCDCDAIADKYNTFAWSSDGKERAPITYKCQHMHGCKNA